jgi:hypothetical protein
VVRRGTVLLVVLLVSVVVAATAWAKSEHTLAKAACIIGAGTWDGSVTAGGAAARSVVSTKPFSDLTAAKDKALRKVARAVVNDPDAENAVHAFGVWCKEHFPTVAKVRASSFAVSALSKKSG